MSLSHLSPSEPSYSANDRVKMNSITSISSLDNMETDYEIHESDCSDIESTQVGNRIPIQHEDTQNHFSDMKSVFESNNSSLETMGISVVHHQLLQPLPCMLVI